MNEEEQLVVALDVITEGAPAAKTLPPEFQSEAFRADTAAIHNTHRSWAQSKGIQGLGISEKVTLGKKSGELALMVYVDTKRAESKLDKAAVVPRELKIPGFSRPLKTDVEAIGVVRPQANTSRVRPAMPGFSIAHVDLTELAGTMGCLVRKEGDRDSLYILSNSHILANIGLGKEGDNVLQPGKRDGGSTQDDLIATLDSFVPYEFTATGYPNLVDAAIAYVKNVDQVTSAIRLIGVPKGASTTLRRGMQVQKTGRMTDYTIGIVMDVHYKTQLEYQTPRGGTGRAGFSDQVRCTRFTGDGDSGAAVLNMEGEVVGLHFAGSDTSSIFNKISNVLDRLKIFVVT